MTSTTPAPRHYAASEMTRLLCAGARLDATFGDKVIDVLLGDRLRFAAPAYGYDAVCVLGHALDARRLRRVRTVAVLLGLLTAIYLLVVSAVGIVGGFLLFVWATWAAVFAERLIALQHLVTYLKAREVGGGSFAGRYPASDYLSQAVSDEIAAEQDTDTGVVHYGGYQPFVGAGNQVRNWSFSALLDPAESLAAAVTGDTDRDPAEAKPFSVDDLTSYVRARLGPVLTTESADGQRIEQLDITRRWYRKAIAAVRPSVVREAAMVPRQRTDGPRLYDSAREYLCVRIGSWDHELVTSVFVCFDLKGRMLYTELHGYVLMPIRPKFRLVDQLPDHLTAGVVLGVAGQAAKSVVVGVFRGIVTAPVLAYRAVAGLMKSVLRRRSDKSALEPGDLTRYARDLTDHGALVSIRELAAIEDYHHYFQEVDAEKYITIIERRLMEIVLDFLEDKKVDTREFRARQTTVLNYGVIYSGSGDVVNTGTQAFGPNSSAAATVPTS